MLTKNSDTLLSTPARKQVLDILEAGISACKAEAVVLKHVSLEGDILRIKDMHYALSEYKRVVLIGFGKMSGAVAQALEQIVPIEQGIVIDTESVNTGSVKVLVGTHPFPSVENLEATKKIIEFAYSLGEGDFVLCIVSGGGSALLCAPSISFPTYIELLKERIFSGIDIHSLNAWRKEHSLVKGGQLAKLIAPAKIVNLYFSDVIGDDMEVIASGPTYIDEADNLLLLSNMTAISAMMAKARQLKLEPHLHTASLKGEASEIGAYLVETFTKEKENCLIAAGECIVTVTGKGTGGRNMELCLGALERIGNLTLAAIGSDGVDGPTDAAGAIVDKGTLRRAESSGLNIKHCLRNNDSYSFFKKTGDLIITGKTGTNVMDLVVAVKDR